MKKYTDADVDQFLKTFGAGLAKLAAQWYVGHDKPDFDAARTAKLMDMSEFALGVLAGHYLAYTSVVNAIEMETLA